MRGILLEVFCDGNVNNRSEMSDLVSMWLSDDLWKNVSFQNIAFVDPVTVDGCNWNSNSHFIFCLCNASVSSLKAESK